MMKMKVVGTSSRGTITKIHIPLMGFSKFTNQSMKLAKNKNMKKIVLAFSGVVLTHR